MTEPQAPWTRIDPNSERGRAVTAGLAKILAGVEMRKAARNAAAGREGHTSVPPQREEAREA